MGSSRILVIDDERNIRHAVRSALEAEGYDVQLVKSAQQALECCRKQRFDLLLLDMHMPEMGGLELIEELLIEHIEESCGFPRIIVMTALLHVPEAAQGLSLGAVEFLMKPFTPQALREAVARVLRREPVRPGPRADYGTLCRHSREALRRDNLDEALLDARSAYTLAQTRPEALNLIGVVFDMRNDWLEAIKNYRLALELDPDYLPPKQNLRRAVSADYRSVPPVLD